MSTLLLLTRAGPTLVRFRGQGTLGVAGIVEYQQVPSVMFGGAGELSLTGEAGLAPAEMILEILDPNQDQAPTSVTVVVAEAWPLREVDFYLDGILIWTGFTDTYGGMSPTSISISAELGTQGTHTLTAQQPGAFMGSATFTLARPPAPAPVIVGADAQAVDVTGAVRANGTRRWILQDLLPSEAGGIGSWIMPYNPKEMTSPHLERSYSTRHTTALSGQHHIFEGGKVPVEWVFSGFAPTQEMHDKLLQYGDLNRRLYVIDHRKRAWKVVILDVDLSPRLQENFEGAQVDGHDYSVTAMVLDQEWVAAP